MPSIEESKDWYQIASGHMQLGGKLFGFVLQLYVYTHLDSGLPDSPLVVSIDSAVLSGDRFELDPSETVLQIGNRIYRGRGEMCSRSSVLGAPLLQPKVLTKRDCVRLVFDAPSPHSWKHARLTISGLKRNGALVPVPEINLDLKRVRKPGSFM